MTKLYLSKGQYGVRRIYKTGCGAGQNVLCSQVVSRYVVSAKRFTLLRCRETRYTDRRFARQRRSSVERYKSMTSRKTWFLRMLAASLISFLLLATLASAQSLPRLKPLPPKKNANARATLAATSSRWQILPNQPPVLDYTDCGPGAPILLTDGTVLVQDAGCQDWWKLTPDSNGSYVNGTWSQIASLPSDYSPLYHSSAVLPDGRFIIEGGEYNFLKPAWTDLGAIYDPVADKWTPVAPPSFFVGCCGIDHPTIGDAQSVILADGTYMQANCCSKQAALLNAKTMTWTMVDKGKFDPNNEEGWNLLPNGKVLTVDAYVPIPPFPFMPEGTNSELFDPATRTWHSAGSTIVQLWDSQLQCGEKSPTFEVGPAVLRPDGTVFYTGANTCGAPYAGHTAIYNSYTGTWTAGPDFPPGLSIADGTAALEPNGKVLMMASPGFGAPPSKVFEWNGTNLTHIPGPPDADEIGSYYGNMLVLPTGQILFTDFIYVQIFTPSGKFNGEWRPIVQSVPTTISPGGSYVASGYRFNGMSQGAAYGDDNQMATNFPIIRITNNATGHVFYTRTHDHSSMAVASPALVSTHFDVPSDVELGPSELEVVANGIPSRPVSVTVQ